jgi:phosphosulfolactate phosphohydrolase-like enzyme
VTIVCAGSGASFSLEDFACAGGLVEAIAAEAGGVIGDDGARTAREVWSRYGGDLEAFLRQTDHGRVLEQLGFGADVTAAARQDALSSVPMLRDGRLTLEASPSVSAPAR